MAQNAQSRFRRRPPRGQSPALLAIGGAVLMLGWSGVQQLAFGSPPSAWVYFADLLVLCLYSLLLAGAFRRAARQYRGLAEVAVREERRRMARDLHDGPAQELAFIASQASRLSTGEPAELAGQIRLAAKRALAESREVIEALSEPVEQELDRAIERAAAELTARADVELRLALTPGLAVPALLRDTLVRIAREAITNAIRHGDPRAVSVRLDELDGLRLTIVDDGLGFHPQSPRRKGLGLASMRERAREIGGALTLTSSPGAGTRVDFRLPRHTGAAFRR